MRRFAPLEEVCTCGFDGLAHARHLMGAEIVHHDDVAWREARHEDLLDIGQECIAVHRAIDDTGRSGRRGTAENRRAPREPHRRILAWRVFWMTMINRTTPAANPELAITDVEMKLIDHLVPIRTRAQSE